MSDHETTKVTEVGSTHGLRALVQDSVTLMVTNLDDHTTSVLTLTEGELSFGRSRQAGVIINSERVSRIHATFTRRDLEVSVADSGSRNGTFVNGERIEGPRRLSSGDEVLIGSVCVTLAISRRRARTRLESTRYLDDRLAAEVDRGLQYQRPFGLALISFTGPAEAIDEVTDAISSSLRPMVVLAEYAPNVLAVVLPEHTTAATERAVATICERVDPTVRVAVGIAGFPEHSTTAGGLLARACDALEHSHRTPGVIGRPPDEPTLGSGTVVIDDPKMARIHEQLRRVAEHPITVLIRGETGVGKEVIVGALHQASGRRGPLVRINCASLPETLLESELFGHERGAFTGAERRKIGFFEAADGGTLFLDEVGEMTPALQAKLLRVLEQRKIMRVGGLEEIGVDVRVVCATHKDLEAECKSHTFRTDLYFRISAFTLTVPPLRDRVGEIELLARAFLAEAAGELGRTTPSLSTAALSALRRYSWPGNVRELRNAIDRAMVLYSGDTIALEDLPDTINDLREPGSEGSRDIRHQLANLEREALASALAAAGGSQTEAAKHLGITRRTLIYRMEKYGLKPLPLSRQDG